MILRYHLFVIIRKQTRNVQNKKADTRTEKKISHISYTYYYTVSLMANRVILSIFYANAIITHKNTLIYLKRTKR